MESQLISIQRFITNDQRKIGILKVQNLKAFKVVSFFNTQIIVYQVKQQNYISSNKPSQKPNNSKTLFKTLQTNYHFLVVDWRSVGTTIAVGQNMQICHSPRCKQNR